MGYKQLMPIKHATEFVLACSFVGAVLVGIYKLVELVMV